ncbi:MAG TPA: phosphate ABC transporter substrate-binding protein PstS [Thermoleophilaceae bacterium]
MADPTLRKGTNLHRKRFVGLALAAVFAAVATGLTSSASASDANGSITGAGSSLMAPLMAKWQADFELKNNIKVTYGSVGSGAGIAQITARTVDFGASDAPLTGPQRGACNRCYQIPWALTATGIAFHLDGIRKLKLTGPIVAGIYLGQITNWSDPKIKKINPGVNLPNLKITPAYRSDGSGDTYAFTDYLSRVSKTWKRKVGFSTQVSFPTGVGGKGNDGLTAIVTSTNGAISYISASYIIAHNLGAAALQNRAGRFEYPNLKNIAAAAKGVKIGRFNEMHIVNPPKSKKSAYPLSTFSYVIVPKTTPKKDLLSKFILYAMGAGQKFGAALDFAPIPKVVLNAGKATVKQFQQG